MYLYSIWNLFHSKMEQLPTEGLLSILYGGRSSPAVLFLTPGEHKKNLSKIAETNVSFS